MLGLVHKYKHCKWTEDIIKEVIKEVIIDDIDPLTVFTIDNKKELKIQNEELKEVIKEHIDPLTVSTIDTKTKSKSIKASK